MSATETTGTTQMSHDETQNYEDQFADLLGDLGGSTAVENGDIGSETITTVTKTTVQDGDVITNSEVTTETTEDGISQTQEPAKEASTPTDDKKAIDYMKDRYEGKEEMQKVKLIREPKKLDKSLIRKQPDESELSEAKDGGKAGLPKEQDLVSYTSLGTDYGRKQYENKVEKEKALKEGTAPVPVNRQQVEKVAPPEITKNVRAMFETGQLQDLHAVKKTLINEPAPESGVYENNPVEIEGVVRSTDLNMEGEELQKGMTKNLLNEWKTKGQDDAPKEQRKINLAEDEGKVLENEPEVRTDVVRESDLDTTSQLLLQKGHAKNLKNQFLNRKEEPKEKKVIKLVENEEAERVFESQPTKLEGVYRADDEDLESTVVVVEKGHAKSLKDKFLNRKEEPKERKVIKLVENEEAATVFESQPQHLEGVVRADDNADSDVVLEKGHAKNLKDKFLNRKDDVKERKVIKLFENDEAASVFESQPTHIEGVVRAEDDTPEVQFERGKAKNLAGYWATRTDDVVLEKQAIKIDRESGGPTVLESQPAVLEGVVREGDCPPDEKDINLESGRTKNMASMWQKKDDDDDSQKKVRQPIKLDLSNSGPTVTENEPVELEGVVRSGTVVEEAFPGNRGRTMDIAGKFLKTEEHDTRPKQQIQIERSAGPVVLENEPEAIADDVVRGETHSHTGDLQDLDSGRTKNLVQSWFDKEQDNLSPKTSTSKTVGKPTWMKEIEAARDSGVFENEPEKNEDVVRETDIPHDEQEQLIPDNNAKNMKSLWQKKEELEEAARAKEKPTELVRFTPPREMTPPPVKQQEFQSVQKLTLTPKQQNGHVNGLETPDHLNQQQQMTQQQMPQQQQTQQQAQQKVQPGQGKRRQRKPQQQPAQQQPAAPPSEPQEYDAGPPKQTVKSSTVLVLK